MNTDSRNGPCCEYSATGYCKDGEKCRFAAQTEDQYGNQNRNGTVTSNEVCRFFKAGHCTEGESCRLRHVLEDAQEPLLNNADRAGNINDKNDAVSDGRNVGEEIRIPTEREEQCEAQLLAEKKARQLEIAEREASVTIRQVVMDGSTIVTCGAGLDIQHVVCGFESCFVTIKNLPYNVKRHEIEELITQQGIDIVFFCIVKMQHLSHEVEAKVMADSVCGQRIATILNGMDFRNKSLHTTIDNGGTPNKMAAAESNVNVLRATWKLPTISIVAYYRTSEDAQNAIRKLNNTIFCGRKISAESTLSFYTGHISVKITGLAPTLTTDELQTHFGSYLVKELSLVIFDSKDVERKLRQVMGQKPGFKSFEVRPSKPNGSIVEARIRFCTWDDAKSAQNSFQGQTLGQGYPQLRFWLPKPIRYVLTIPLSQYCAQKRRWDSLPAEGVGNNSAFVRVTNNGIDKAFIRVLGEDKKAVGQLKVRVESLVAGETLDLKLWHRFFLGPAGQRLLEDISARTKTYFRSDWKSRTLKLYADGDAEQTVINLIRAEIERLEASESAIYIHRHAIGFFMHKVLPILHEELGEDAVTLELLPTPRLIIRGGEEARRVVDRLIEESRVGIESEIRGSEQNTCPICFDEVTIPIRLTCSHFYCTACLRHFLSSAAERKTFPLVCSGDEDRCKIPIAVPIIQRYLLQQQFDRLVEMAATTYFEKQQTKFKYCTTPECRQVYRCETGSRILTCPSCFATVCAGCHKEAHEGMTCKEKRIMSDRKEQERLNEEWAMTVGAKRCPSCRVLIQKTEGCNHMTCRCGTHLCWLCLATFREGQNVYTHMNSVHGGIYEDEHQGAQIDGNEIQHVDLVQEQANLVLAWRLQAEEDAGNVVLLRDHIAAQQIQAQWEREPRRVGMLHNVEEQWRQRAEQEAQQRAAEQDVQQRAAEHEAQQRAAEQEAQQRAAEQEALQHAAEQEALQYAAEHEAQQRAAEQEAQQHAAEQAQQCAAEQEAQQRVAEQEAQQRAAEQEVQHVRGIATRVREIREQRAAQNKGGRWCIIM